MVIDNSAANAFRTCPLLYYESYVRNLALKPADNRVEPMDLGSRVHELLEEYYQGMHGTPILQYKPSSNETLELEAQMIMAAYRAKYPVEEFEIVDVERTFKVQLPDSEHIYTGKIDLVRIEGQGLSIIDHKTQKSRSNSNHPKKWAARDQASLYLWAASKIYQRPIQSFYVNVLIRPEEKRGGMAGPVFPERMKIERTAEQIKIAVRDLTFLADEIERYQTTFGDSLWPSNRENCTEGTWGDCEFYLPHTYGWSEEILAQKYTQKKPYLKLEDVPVIRKAVGFKSSYQKSDAMEVFCERNTEDVFEELFCCDALDCEKIE